MEMKIVLEEQEEGGFTVYVPSLPGCVSQGENIKEAMQNIKEAIELYLDTEIRDIGNKGRVVNIEI
ncbi:type II toxin-antitoxin system HicB family antitoxin [Candidatus Pacearchaeota archaeon]|nr:type II toxin-antitoxin system HicB family antitoxin [Candidatus Pacearchaeota archaeon]